MVRRCNVCLTALEFGADRGRHFTLTQREGFTARAFVGNDPAVPLVSLVSNRQTIQKDEVQIDTGPAIEHADYIWC